jgi:uncharacterized protein (TIGR03083 family)
MDRDTYMHHLARDGRRMAELARGDLEAMVPTCPDWKLVDLIEHTGMVHRWQTTTVRDRPPSFPDESVWRLGPADGVSWADWFQAGVDDAVRVIGAADPASGCWTWFEPDQTAGFFQRRITLETLVHRLDAELAATGTITAVDPVLGTDAIDEVFDVMVPATAPSPVGGRGETVHLHATDGDGEWVVTLLADTVTVERTHAKADAAVRASTADLVLFIWGREPVGPVERFGDPAAAELLAAACRD